jgi:hypothetical protein
MSDTQALALNSDPLGIGRHVKRPRRSLQRPYRRVPHRARPAFRRLDRDHLQQHEQSGRIRRGWDRRAGGRRAATAGRPWCHSLPDGVRANVRCRPGSASTTTAGAGSSLGVTDEAHYGARVRSPPAARKASNPCRSAPATGAAPLHAGWRRAAAGAHLRGINEKCSKNAKDRVEECRILAR